MPEFIRKLLRLARLGWVISTGALLLPLFLLRYRSQERSARVAWMQWMSKRFLSLLHCKVSLSGTVPCEGLLVSNHLGYVDILVLGSLCPAIFVAKSDVNSWPVFGWLARHAGTLFVDRENPSRVPGQLAAMEEPLSQGVPVILFPEGTSSAGETVLLFRSSLLESAVRTGSRVTPVSIRYDLAGKGDPGHEIAYWGDHSLPHHLLNLLSKPEFHAEVRFGANRPIGTNRKAEAIQLHTEVASLLQQRP
jgi:1-acyl-sn-glycerol-3-phosphate acyltransferase